MEEDQPKLLEIHLSLVCVYYAISLQTISLIYYGRPEGADSRLVDWRPHAHPRTHAHTAASTHARLHPPTPLHTHTHTHTCAPDRRNARAHTLTRTVEHTHAYIPMHARTIAHMRTLLLVYAHPTHKPLPIIADDAMRLCR